MFDFFFIFAMWFFHNSIRFKVNKYWQDVVRYLANLILPLLLDESSHCTFFRTNHLSTINRNLLFMKI